jgi:hypothetical protein
VSIKVPSKKSTKQADTADAALTRFVQSAPDGKHGQPPDQANEMIAISLRLSRRDLDRFDRVAKSLALGRSAFIRMASAHFCDERGE